MLKQHNNGHNERLDNVVRVFEGLIDAKVVVLECAVLVRPPQCDVVALKQQEPPPNPLFCVPIRSDFKQR
jgi:hypothetical protein